MKILAFMVLGIVISSAAYAQSLQVDELQALYEQHQMELTKLKSTAARTKSELEEVQDKIKTANYKISIAAGKINEICEKIKLLSGESSINPICR